MKKFLIPIFLLLILPGILALNSYSNGYTHNDGTPVKGIIQETTNKQSQYTNNYSLNTRVTMLPMICKSDLDKNGWITEIDLYWFDILKSWMSYNPSMLKVVLDIDNDGIVGLRDRDLLKSFIGMQRITLC